MSRRALILLRLRDDVVFSARAATEGMHRSLPHPPGAALLGWAARRYTEFEDPWTIFHSGSARFSNALPLSKKSLRPAFPTPQTLLVRKDQEHKTEMGLLDRDVVRSRRPERDEAERDEKLPVQWEAFGKDEFVTAAHEIVEPATGRRLRTATEQGRAKTSSLFEYGHLEGAQLFAATVEADEITKKDWCKLTECFRGEIALGRSKSAEYGGADAFWLEKNAPELWPTSAAGDGEWLILWALSDIAAVDENGAPTLEPSLQHLFADAPKHGRLDRARSAVSGRRWGPWNSYIDCRDSERVVIAAGSVLVYKRPVGWAPKPDCRAGLWQEAGLGQLWADPPLLNGADDLLPEPATDTPTLEVEIEQAREAWGRGALPSAASPEPSQLMEWLKRKAELRAPLSDYSPLNTWRNELRAMYKSARAKGMRGPSASHWGAIAALAKTSADIGAYQGKLYATMGSGGAGQLDTWDAPTTRTGGPEGETFRNWLANVASALAEDDNVVATRKLAALRLLADEGRRLVKVAKKGTRQ
jgi:hypothetical protein